MNSILHARAIALFLVFLLCQCFNAHAQLPPGFTDNAPCSMNSNSIPWDWRGNVDYTMYIAGPTGSGYPNNAVPMPSPWFASRNPSRDKNNLNINDFTVQNPKDYEPADGWMLVRKEFGSPGNLVNHPYFILYNKYTSVLRIFVAISDVIGQDNKAVISLTYGNGAAAVKKTAVLEHYSPLNKQWYRQFPNWSTGEGGMDGFDNTVPRIDVPNVYSFDLPYWLHADFVMNYDPCTCNSLSQLYFDVRLISSSNLSLSINGTAIQQLNSSDNTWSQSTTGETTVSTGAAVIQDFNSAVGIITKVLGITGDGNVLKNIPVLGQIIGLSSFLGGFIGDNQPKPMVFNLKLDATGSITTDNGHKSIIIENPGSNDLSLIPPTPITYNNIMGVFNLLNRPKIQYTYGYDPNQPVGRQYYTTYVIPDQIQYAINPAAGFTNAEVRGAIEFEFGNSGNANTAVNGGNGNDLNHLLLKESETIYRTRFLPLEVIGTPPYGVSLITINSNHPEFADANLSLLLMVTFTTPNGKQVLYTTRYSVIVEHLANNAYGVMTANPIQQENITIPDNGTISGNLFAWNTITIGHNVTFSTSPNQYYQIKAQNIVTPPGFTYPSNFTVQTFDQSGYPGAFADSYDQVAPGDIKSFCNGSTSTGLAYVNKANSAIPKTMAHQGNAFTINADSLAASGVTLLGQAYPNPGVGTVRIPYQLGRRSTVSIYLTDLTGQQRFFLVREKTQEAGSYQEPVNIPGLKSGTYFYTMQTESYRETKKLVIVE